MYDAKVIKDSISYGVRLTTLQVTFPRIVLAEFNTHRTLCLAGDSELEFDLPSGQHNARGRRVYRMCLDEFVDKWINGARRKGSNPKIDYDLSWVDLDKRYSPPDIASRLGMANPGNINRLCREGKIPAVKSALGTWMITGEEIVNWRQSKPGHSRFDMRSKLRNMYIRQLNEDTGDIQCSHVRNVFVSGEKEVFEVRAGEDFHVAGSADHRVLTADGWKTIGEIEPGDFLVVRKFGNRDEDKLDPLRLKKIDGLWRSVWQRKIRDRLLEEDLTCRRCEDAFAMHVHHIVPVYEDPSLAFEEDNVTLLCEECHKKEHEVQGWQGGMYLYGSLSEVTEIVSRGVEQTYDLEISGPYPNFIANGVVVHNSRNSASSRAIPVKKRIQQIRDNPFVPGAFGKNKKGMQAGEDLDSQDDARAQWMNACGHALACAERLSDLKVHKQWANRLLEPFSWHTVIVTATEWENFFNLRISEDAQPEIRRAAELMKNAMDQSMLNDEVEWLQPGDWHLPLIQDDEYYLPNTTLYRISAARCARVSYLTHDGVRDIEADLNLHDKLLSKGHMSPFEHPAMVGNEFPGFCGNFRRPWVQYRKMIPGESVFRKGDENE